MRPPASGRRPAGGAHVAAAAALIAAALLAHPAAATTLPGSLTEGAIEHIRGTYLQRAIEIATVGARTVHLTRMTRFRRCGRVRGTAEDFNGHLVEVVGREVDGIGFVAGLVNTIDACPPAAEFSRGPGD
jgi:hypothetical protein